VANSWQNLAIFLAIFGNFLAFLPKIAKNFKKNWQILATTCATGEVR